MNKVKLRLRDTDNSQRVNIQYDEILQISKKHKLPKRKMSKDYKKATHRRNTNGQYEKTLNLTTCEKQQSTLRQ